MHPQLLVGGRKLSGIASQAGRVLACLRLRFAAALQLGTSGLSRQSCTCALISPDRRLFFFFFRFVCVFGRLFFHIVIRSLRPPRSGLASLARQHLVPRLSRRLLSSFRAYELCHTDYVLGTLPRCGKTSAWVAQGMAGIGLLAPVRRLPNCLPASGASMDPLAECSSNRRQVTMSTAAIPPAPPRSL